MIMCVNPKTALILASVAASLVLASPPASAQEAPLIIQGVAPSYIHFQHVPYWDLNLATRAGERRLNWRVSSAVKRVCLYDPGIAYGYADPDYRQCSGGAWRGARPQMNAAVYRARQLAYYRGY